MEKTRKWAQTVAALLPREILEDDAFRAAISEGDESLVSYLEQKAEATSQSAEALRATYPKMDALERRLSPDRRSVPYDFRSDDPHLAYLRAVVREAGVFASEEDLKEWAWYREKMADLTGLESGLREFARCIRTGTPLRRSFWGGMVPDRRRRVDPTADSN